MKGLKYIVTGVCAAALFAYSGFSSSLQAAELKIGVVNMQKVLTTSSAGKKAQSIIEQKLGKSIELHMLVAEDHQQTNLSQITVDQAIRDNIHMDVVIEED